MNILKKNSIGLIGGFIFGTLGIFLLALLSLISPIIELVASPFLFPGRYFASLLAGSSASSAMVAVLYLCTGIFYAIVGILIQEIIRSIQPKRPPSMLMKPKKK